MCWLQQSAQLWHYPTFLLVPLLIVSFVECFAGYFAWRFLVGFNGAVLGFAGGAFVAVYFFLMPMLALPGAVAGAIVGAALFAGNVKFGTFVFAFGSVTSFAVVAAHLAGVDGNSVMIAAGGAGLAAAIASARLCRVVMIAIAAVAGAQQLASAWCAYMLPGDSPPLADVLATRELAEFMSFATSGLLAQFTASWLLRRNQAKRLQTARIAHDQRAEPDRPVLAS